MYQFKNDKVSEENYKSLISDIKKNSLICWCGAGLSVPAGYPTAFELIKELHDLYRKSSDNNELAEDYKHQIESGNASLRVIADKVKKPIGDTSYNDLLKTLFESRASWDFSYEHECLVRLPVNSWITTNYDSCISNAIENDLRNVRNSSKSLKVIDEFSLDFFYNKKDDKQVWHIHGRIGDIKKIILTNEDYEKFYEENNSEREKELGSIINRPDSTLLFIGYSFGDEEINSYLKENKSLIKKIGQKNYAILPKNPQDPWPAALNDCLKENYNIYPVFYNAPNGDHSQRLDLIKALAGELKQDLPEENSQEEISLEWKFDTKELRHELKYLKSELNKIKEEFNFDRFILKRCSINKKFLSLIVDNDKIETFKKSLENNVFFNLSNESKYKIVEAERPKEADLNKSYINQKRKEATSDYLFKNKNTVSEDITEPLYPKPLKFGLTDIFHPIIDWRLDSPIINIWFYTGNNGEIRAVTAVGKGMDFIRKEIEIDVFNVALHLKSGYDNVITNGFIYLNTTDDNDRKKEVKKKSRNRFYDRLKDLVTILPLGNTEEANTILNRDLPEDLDSALKKLRSNCIGIQQKTGFVIVHEVPYTELESNRDKLFEAIDEANDEGPIIIYEEENKKNKVLYPETYRLFKDPAKKIALPVSSDILESKWFKDILNNYYKAVLGNLKSDLLRRKEILEGRLKENKLEIKWFEKLDDDEIDKMEDIVPNIRYNEQLGIYENVKGTPVKPRFYFSTSLKDIIEDTELKIKSIDDAIKRIPKDDEDSYLKQYCISRIFDCALREIDLCDNRQCNDLFINWRRKIKGLFKAEWKDYLENNLKIPVSFIFKRTTFFKLDCDENSKYSIIPIAIIDSKRSNILIDNSNKTFLVYDPLDDAKSIKIKSYLLEKEDIFDPTNLLDKIKSSSDPVSTEIKNIIENIDIPVENTAEYIANALNDFIGGKNFYLANYDIKQYLNNLNNDKNIRLIENYSERSDQATNYNLLQYIYPDQIKNKKNEFFEKLNGFLDKNPSDNKAILELIYKYGIEYLEEILEKNFNIKHLEDLKKIHNKNKSKVLKEVKDKTAGRRGQYFYINGAYNSALNIVKNEGNTPGKLILNFIHDCMINGYSFKETIKLLLDGKKHGIPHFIIEKYNEIKNNDPDSLKNYISKGYMINDDEFTPEDKETFELVSGIESILESLKLAELFWDISERLDDDEETQDRVFIKAERAFEEAYNAYFSSPEYTMIDLQKTLSREPKEEFERGNT